MDPRYNSYLPYRFDEEWLTIGSPATFDETYDDGASGQDILISGITGADADTYIDLLYIQPILSASQNDAQHFELIARATDPGASFDNTAYTAATDRIGLRHSYLVASTVPSQFAGYPVELPVRAKWLGLRQVNTGDTTRTCSILIYGRVANSGTANRDRYR